MGLSTEMVHVTLVRAKQSPIDEIKRTNFILTAEGCVQKSKILLLLDVESREIPNPGNSREISVPEYRESREQK